MNTFNELYETFKKWQSQDDKCQSLWAKVENKTASYRDAELYAERIAVKWSELLNDNYGQGDYTEFIDDITESLKKSYSNSAYYAKNVQKIVNEGERIGMKAFEPAVDDDRIQNLARKLIEEEQESLLSEYSIGSIARSAVTDTIEYNARKQSDAGLYAYVERDPASGCCAWCNSIGGRYEYGDQPKDFFAVHKGCTCTISYKPSRYALVQKIRYESIGNKIRKIVE